MRFIRIRNCKSGMTVARPIHGPYGILMLNEGNVLSPRVIYALEKLGYPGVYIEDDVSADVALDEAIDEKARRAATYLVKEMFSKAAMSKADKNIQMFESIQDLLGDMVDHIFSSDLTVLNVPMLKSFDDYTYQHSVDVGVLAISLGKAMGLKKAEVLDLGKAAFFHDIGKMFVPKSILNKPTKLTREEMLVMRKHPEFSFDFAKSVLGQPPVVNRSVLSHHERFDGMGYPNSLKGSDIPLFSQIIAMADVFDALGSARVYKKAMPATEGYEYVLGNAGFHFSAALVEIFAKTIAPFPVGVTVQLSNGLHAVVIRNNNQFMTRPLLRTFAPEDPSNYEYLNLATDLAALSVTILGIV